MTTLFVLFFRVVKPLVFTEDPYSSKCKKRLLQGKLTTITKLYGDNFLSYFKGIGRPGFPTTLKSFQSRVVP